MFWDISGRNYFYDYGLNGLLMEIHPYGTPHQLIDHRNTIYLEPGACTNIDIEEVCYVVTVILHEGFVRLKLSKRNVITILTVKVGAW